MGDPIGVYFRDGYNSVVAPAFENWGVLRLRCAVKVAYDVDKDGLIDVIGCESSIGKAYAGPETAGWGAIVRDDRYRDAAKKLTGYDVYDKPATSGELKEIQKVFRAGIQLGLKRFAEMKLALKKNPAGLLPNKDKLTINWRYNTRLWFTQRGFMSGVCATPFDTLHSTDDALYLHIDDPGKLSQLRPELDQMLIGLCSR